MLKLRRLIVLIGLASLCAAGMLGAQALVPDAATGGPDIARTQARMASARAEGEAARRRAERLESEARSVTEAADRTAHDAAALAARIQQNQAALTEQRGRLALIAREQGQMRAALALRQAPLIRLTAALQRFSRRPAVLSLLRPGSVRDTVYLRALFQTMMPEVEARTAVLRDDLARSRALAVRWREAALALRQTQAALDGQHARLAALESQQRLASRQASGLAAREADKALALAESARDLGDLAQRIGVEGDLREQLARLPGPVMRPPRPEDSQVIDAGAFVPATAGFSSYILPVTGRVVAGFGEQRDAQAPSRGITLATGSNAQAVAPAPGRIAYADRFRGFGEIVIIEHPGGWTSLVTGLARLDVRVGQQVVAGSPLGIAGPVDPQVTLELRKDGEPVNPLQFLRAP